MEISVFCWFWTEIRGDRKIETQWSRWMACWDWSFKVNVLRSVDSQFHSPTAFERILTRRRRLTTDWRLIFIFILIAEIISGAGLQTPAVTLPRGRRPTVLANSGVMAAAGGAAATSVVVLDRGNNTTCTINLHGKHDKSFISINLGHCPRCQFVWHRSAATCSWWRIFGRWFFLSIRPEKRGLSPNSKPRQLSWNWCHGIDLQTFAKHSFPKKEKPSPEQLFQMSHFRLQFLDTTANKLSKNHSIVWLN